MFGEFSARRGNLSDGMSSGKLFRVRKVWVNVGRKGMSRCPCRLHKSVHEVVMIWVHHG